MAVDEHAQLSTPIVRTLFEASVLVVVDHGTGKAAVVEPAAVVPVLTFRR